MDCELLHGDCRSVLATLAAESVHCVVTSPPYWGLRDYGVEPLIWGGNPDCQHEFRSVRYYREGGNSGSCKDAFHEAGPENAERLKETRWRETSDCIWCDAWRGSLGLEPSPELYVEHLIEVFRQVWRVLRDDGTLWLNLGDCYNAYNGGAGPSSKIDRRRSEERPQLPTGYGLRAPALKPKDLIGVPWMVAFALRADGWYLRQRIVWCKPAPMPESVTDRCTTATEELFMLTKQARYYYDAEAIAEPCQTDPAENYPARARVTGRGQQAYSCAGLGEPHQDKSGGFPPSESGKRNKRNWWVVNTKPCPAAHFATMPEALVTPCIQAASSEWGCCSACGAPWVRQVEKEREGKSLVNAPHAQDMYNLPSSLRRDPTRRLGPGIRDTVRTTDWQPSCTCNADRQPCLILDPFAGSGTVMKVATKLGRRSIGIDLNEEYIGIARERNAQQGLML